MRPGVHDRRHQDREFANVLKAQLNEEQLATLLQIERFGWILKFIRHDDAGDELAAVYDPDHDRFAALEPDGSLNTDPPTRFRR